ncbi:unnamed protein product [Clonostachys solani]|uniref:Uncharacterized protein n=1 Tax=Clonostachys solani TaxID=160281 RepID=A0A9N9YVL5_9HYPO|nr:unnamed protein product [Clonostachys solani]
MSHLSSSQSQVEMEDKPIGRLSKAIAPRPTHPPPTQHHPPSFPGTGQTLDAEGGVLTIEGRMPDAGHAHLQGTVKKDGSDSLIQPSPVASSTSPVIGLEEHMNSSVFLHPKTKKRTWPLLPVACERWSEEEYDFSSKTIVKYLKDAVDYHKTLRDSARNIHYKLMMVGSSLESAKPSILVMCNYIDWGSLNSLLKKMPSQEYNCVIPSTWDRAHKFRFGDGGLSRMSDLKPILWLYLCPTTFETLKRLTGVPVSIECSSLVTMCGSLVAFEGRQSTISLTLDINGEDRLLTVEHIFQDNELENDKPQMSSDAESPASIESNIEQWDFLNDSEDDTSMDLDTDWNSNHDDTEMDRELPATSINCEPSQVSHEPVRPRVEAPARLSRSHKQGERVEPPNSLPHRSPYLDWACLRLVDYQLTPRQRSNVLLRRGKPPGLLEDVATKPRIHAVPVFMISGILGVRSGRLIELPSYLGSSKGQDLCETWAIILDQQEGFYPGESGSIVVDQETLSIYGHLVGLDMFGYGHVVPFSRTIEQIKAAFNVDNAGLPALENSDSHQEGGMGDKDDGELMFLLHVVSPDISKVQQLIERGADVNRPDAYGATPLLRAVRGEYQAIVELLLENDADLSVPGKYGETPLWRAASEGHQAIVELLLDNGADLSVPNEYGETPLWIATIKGHQAIIELLLANGADLSIPNKYGETPLWAAVENGHLPIVKLLLSRGSEVNCKNEHNRKPLWRATQQGHRDIVEALVEAGADTNIVNEVGQTPLQWAAARDHHRMVELLCKAGAEVNITDDGVRAALLLTAINEGYSDLLQQLIKAGAEVNVRDRDGLTPLLYAAQNRDLDITQQLIKAGAEVNVRDRDGLTPLLYAAQNGDSNILEQLIKAGAKVNDGDRDGLIPLLYAAGSRDPDTVQQLIKAGAEVNVKNRDGLTPLLYAAQKGNSNILEQLIKAGAEVNVKNKFELTPLMAAVQSHNETSVQKLLSAGALLDIKDNKGRTALFFAIQRKDNGISQMLIEGGAATDVEDKRGRKPQMIVTVRMGARSSKGPLREGIPLGTGISAIETLGVPN